ncbi:MAG: transposase [Verrucomicrobia bacterium]|nr:transposase [Verrucomicrobiota bacterium]
MWHRERASSEYWIKELKEGFGLERLPSGRFARNAVSMQLGLLAYHLVMALWLHFAHIAVLVVRYARRQSSGSPRVTFISAFFAVLWRPQRSSERLTGVSRWRARSEHVSWPPTHAAKEPPPRPSANPRLAASPYPPIRGSPDRFTS